MVPHTPPFVDGDMSAGNLVTAEWLNWVNERVTDTERFLGFFDASSGDLPPVAFPSAVFLPGDNYEISVTGTLDVVDPVTLLSAPTVVNVGDFIRWVSGSPRLLARLYFNRLARQLLLPMPENSSAKIQGMVISDGPVSNRNPCSRHKFILPPKVAPWTTSSSV